MLRQFINDGQGEDLSFEYKFIKLGFENGEHFNLVPAKIMRNEISENKLLENNLSKS